ncbi:hypothetical protein VRB78_11655 [Pseudomonas trivialis]|jgi:hypothetical protein|uniref:hypothetical protein n=1 Tax=Pseudomonas TaxID=286 RepID=UPI000CF68952|nr:MULTISPECIES: hypothetical protein [Pseudomonas]AVJ38229.1 hypothetical protein CLM75_13065 [Pseudomonas lurida]PRA17869.1 hypothetical protein CQ002_08440 [Pseudomonas sp. MYb13]PRA21003.1 hypothetical protein CQ004_16640 [Pseudomonas lurida]PRA37734.1 hypothetical protein CQ005_06890 [Pseudomonas lurida]PRC02548.1 hypothetical protein CQ014_08525 [Pseudomonas lurida]
MFLTFEHAEAPGGALMRGGHVWRYVEYRPARPWFYVSILELSDDEWTPTTLLISTLEDLQELHRSDSHNLRITQVILVSPGELNGTGCWRMDELSEIAQVRSSERLSLIYKMTNEDKYYEDEGARNTFCRDHQVIWFTPP